MSNILVLDNLEEISKYTFIYQISQNNFFAFSAMTKAHELFKFEEELEIPNDPLIRATTLQKCQQKGDSSAGECLLLNFKGHGFESSSDKGEIPSSL